jgi:hypothetical protein
MSCWGGMRWDLFREADDKFEICVKIELWVLGKHDLIGREELH